MGEGACRGMRIDRLLVYLRIARTRSRASAMVDAGHMRHNGRHITRTSEEIRVGDVLTLMLGTQVKIIEVLELPEQRGSPEKARSHYRELDRSGEKPLAATVQHNLQGNSAT